MKETRNKGREIFINLLKDIFKRRLGDKVIYSLDHNPINPSIRFSYGIYALCRIFLGEKRKLQIFRKNFEGINISFKKDLIELFSFLSFEIEQ